MDRTEFLKLCGAACLGAPVLSSILQSCASSGLVTGKVADGKLVVSVDDVDGGSESPLGRYIVVQNSQLEYPVYVIRSSSGEYTALWMRCTHKGVALQAFGDRLECPAHGSQFASSGNVVKGPADRPLRTLAVTRNDDQLTIALQ